MRSLETCQKTKALAIAIFFYMNKVHGTYALMSDHVMLVDEETVYNDISGGSDGSMASVVTAVLSVLLR